jgi:uncharacterized membrane protein
MNLESAFFSLLVLTGMIFTIAAMVTYIFPPKKINYLYGYRTAGSMKSEERWAFAQKFSAILLLKIGLLLVGISLFGLFYSISTTTDTLAAVLILTAAVVLLIWRTESELKKLP